MSATAIVRAPEPPGEIVGESEVLRRAVERADKVALAECRVLLEGESGTGKELFARRIHARSRRADGPFVAINCSAIPPELFESELFGHERGAFTGAGSERRGLFRQAGGGTLFLDDVPELPEPLQAKLLRALQEARVRPVGSDREVRVDARVVAATHANLAWRTGTGEFREDLYAR
ncbi:MAG: sigma-54 factor interaction domain-containing protein, partial [Mycobacterium sp.]